MKLCAAAVLGWGMTLPVPTPPPVPVEAHAGAWLPWLEANQGLISVAALVIALLAVVIEHRRASRVTEERLGEFKTTLGVVCLEAMDRLDTAPDFERIGAESAKVIEILLRRPPPSPRLIHAAEELRLKFWSWAAGARPVNALAASKQIRGWFDEMMKA